MLLIDQYQHIKKRADFFPAVEKAIQSTFDLLRVAKGDRRLDSILAQLDAIKRWTANGREPTEQERKSTGIGTIIFREFEPAQADEIEAWAKLCREVEGYFQDWLDDATFATIDEDDLSDFDD